jgi:hypothetical protein
MPKAVPPKEMPIAGGATIPAGQLVVCDGKVIVNPTTQTAASLLASVGAAKVTTCSVVDRWGTFPSTGLPIFDVF